MSVLLDLDWSRPWYRTIGTVAQQVLAQPDWRAHLNQLAHLHELTNHQGLPVQFVAQSELPDGMAYEAFISATGKVPTRDNAHDFFNALMWLAMPRIKQQLNGLQAAQIAREGVGATRGARRDAATLFDENAALLVVRDGEQGESLLAALRTHDWQQALLQQRQVFMDNVQVWLFGHALLEKLATPYKAITAHAWVVRAPDEFFNDSVQQQQTWLDVQVSTALQQRSLTPEQFTPLPVLGVPGWWPQQNEAFYADKSVFRPKRVRPALSLD